MLSNRQPCIGCIICQVLQLTKPFICFVECLCLILTCALQRQTHYHTHTWTKADLDTTLVCACVVPAHQMDGSIAEVRIAFCSPYGGVICVPNRISMFFKLFANLNFGDVILSLVHESRKIHHYESHIQFQPTFSSYLLIRRYHSQLDQTLPLANPFIKCYHWQIRLTNPSNTTIGRRIFRAYLSHLQYNLIGKRYTAYFACSIDSHLTYVNPPFWSYI